MAKKKFFWDPISDNILLEKNEAGDTTVVYTQEPDLYGNLISQRRDGQTSYYHFDALGSTRALTDENENVTDTYLNDAWGVEKARTGTTVNPFQWVGQKGYYTDEETGMIQIRAREYEPIVARWTSFDPIQFIDGLNLYVYAENSPTGNWDSTGLSVQPNRIISAGDACERATAGKKRLDRLTSLRSYGQFRRNLYIEGLKRLKRDPLRAAGLDVLKNPDVLDFLIADPTLLVLSANSAEHWAGARTDARNAFVFTCNCGWIDLGHFWASAVAGYSSGSLAALTVGYIVELVQLLGPGPVTWRQSQFTIEDLPSDKFGAQFGGWLKRRPPDKSEEIAEAFCRGLASCGPVALNAYTRPVLEREATRLRDELLRGPSTEPWRGDAHFRLCCDVPDQRALDTIRWLV